MTDNPACNGCRGVLVGAALAGVLWLALASMTPLDLALTALALVVWLVVVAMRHMILIDEKRKNTHG